jgi:hypothetical protein
MTVFPAGSDADRAEQQALADIRDRDTGPDFTGVHPLAERIRHAFDTADRIDQSWTLPHADDDYDCLAY